MHMRTLGIWRGGRAGYGRRPVTSATEDEEEEEDEKENANYEDGADNDDDGDAEDAAKGVEVWKPWRKPHLSN